MATITRTIGTDVSRDYSSIAAWEADLDDGGIYSASDDAVGDMYNDGEFTSAGHVVLNGGGTIGLNSVLLQAADSDERHDGTAGTGCRLRITANTFFVILAVQSGVPLTVDWLEINGNNVAKTSRQGAVRFATDDQVLNHCIIHDYEDTDAYFGITDTSNHLPTILNTLVYDAQGGSSLSDGIGRGSGQAYKKFIHNCVVQNVQRYGIINNNDTGSDGACSNNVSVDTGNSAFAVSFDPESYNAADDTTASGTGSIDNITVADNFVSTTNGSEDFHTKSGADLVDAGTDLGTSPTGVEVDIDGRDRDSNGDTWDIGAHELVVVASGTGVKSPLSGSFSFPIQGPL